MWRFLFGDESLLRQAYAQFFLSLLLVGLVLLPSRQLLQLTYLLSVWAIIISAQTFISSAKGNRRVAKIEQHLDIDVEVDQPETGEGV